ncbi:unnamed protein product [Psylliodes chrysocephalus]|uniref:DUF4371 domain-containing protein n=1 Tax=Psylliodes chrysocephalus TaxID=3402493 RepID=A0A9P0CJD5_9CUCU|nr:unnamed protein product [Psylliodes chrysocephala]
MKSHEKSKVHMNNVFSFSMLGKLNIKTQLNSAYRDALIKHNQQVDKNLYVLNKIINCIRFCGAFELALRGHDEKDNLENRGIFKELVNFSAELDNDLKVHIQSSKAFKGTSKITQNELLECMLDVYHEEVRKEIENSPFVHDAKSIAECILNVLVYLNLYELLKEVQLTLWCIIIINLIPSARLFKSFK